MERLRLEITGHVQGVGFRPHVHRLASELSLTGWVCNTASGVELEIQGEAASEFVPRLQAELPPLAEIDHMTQKFLSPKSGETVFSFEPSQPGIITTKLLPDVAMCETCLSELFDPQSRYYLYPFVSCTHCGPRCTVSEKLPFDRENTSMQTFSFCKSCRQAYENPGDRRYHAQLIACAQCGPKLSMSVEKIADFILSGKIVALKGLGGYQLICDAQNTETVKRLRQNKMRESKPFACMALNVSSIRQWVHCSSEAEKTLFSKERPIVLLSQKSMDLFKGVAPGLNNLGFMLPSTPLHYVLFHALLGSPEGFAWLQESHSVGLIVTSANVSGSPLIKDDGEAHTQLSGVADVVVSYDREIITRMDDSVVTLINNKRIFIRRARGFAPRAIALPDEIPSTLALGGYLKNTICVTRGREAFVSQHIGDLGHSKTRRVYRETIQRFLKILDVKPECIAHDLHPDCYSRQLAQEFIVPSVAIQHHHAHLAANAVEHGLTEDALGLALDGFGFGERGETWGGELIHYQGATYKRLGSFKPILQPGGDAAAREPWRMTVSVLFELGLLDEIFKRFSHQKQLGGLLNLLEKSIQSPATSSCGRLFDAASAALGVCETSSYEGEAAMLLESQVTKPLVVEDAWEIRENKLNMLPLFKILLDCDAKTGANLFHGTLIAALAEWIQQNALNQLSKIVLLSGGCFLNRVLSEGLMSQLKKTGLTPLYPSQFPVNDGGISLGQAWIAGSKQCA